jgi:hypothetical protein
MHTVKIYYSFCSECYRKIYVEIFIEEMTGFHRIDLRLKHKVSVKSCVNAAEIISPCH